jgi:hypothetical protein
MTTTPTPLLVDAEGACAMLGGISRTQLTRLVHSGQLPVVRLPGARDRSGRGTNAVSRRVLYAVADLQRLVEKSTERASAEPALSVIARRR